MINAFVFVDKQVNICCMSAHVKIKSNLFGEAAEHKVLFKLKYY